MTDPGSCRPIDQQADSKLPRTAFERRPFNFYLYVFRFVLFVLFFLARGGKGGRGIGLRHHRPRQLQTDRSTGLQ